MLEVIYGIFVVIVYNVVIEFVERVFILLYVIFLGYGCVFWESCLGNGLIVVFVVGNDWIWK